MKTGAVIQARMRSTRLPGKVMLPLAGKPVIDHVIARMKQCVRLDEVVIATTVDPADDVLVERATANGAASFRGSEADVLGRYYRAAMAHGLDVVVRITCDCPLIDPHVTDEIVGAFGATDCVLVTNAGDGPSERTYPRGLDVEVFSFDALAEAFACATTGEQREHVTPWIYETKRVHHHRSRVDFSGYRWTLDTWDDYRLLEEIYRHLYHGTHDFYLPEIVALIEAQPELAAINAHVEQTKLEYAALLRRDQDAR